MKCFFLLTLLLPCMASAQADELLVAVASNFNATMQQIARRFEQQSGYRVRISSGATGKHYAQISHGAPFDVFFAADEKRPRLLQQQGLAQGRFTYALGKLVLWSPDPDLIDGDEQVLSSQRFRFLAIANPKLAPYGRAAQQVLQKLKLWRRLQAQLVRGENVGQAFQYVKSGNAQLGFVAASQLKQGEAAGSWWQAPQRWYRPIRQQAVRLNNRKATQQFMDFVRSDAVRQLIRQSGYQTP